MSIRLQSLNKWPSNTVTTSFNTVEQMTEMSQRKNYRCGQFASSEQLNHTALMQASFHTV